MNPKLLRPSFLIPALSASVLLSLGFILLRLLTSQPLGLSEVIYGFWVGPLGCLLHEKIARCGSPLWEKSLRFGSLLFSLTFVPAYILRAFILPVEFHAGLMLILIWAIYVVSFAPAVALLYRFNPKGESPYFSISGKKFSPPGS